MAELFQDRIERGRPPRQREYVLQQAQLLLHFEPDVPVEDVTAAIDSVAYNMPDVDGGPDIAVRIQEYIWPSELDYDAAALRAANVRRVGLAPLGGPSAIITPEQLAKAAGGLTSQIEILRMATPIYVSDDAEHTAISPLLDTFRIRLHDTATDDDWTALINDFDFTAAPDLSFPAGSAMPPYPFRSLLMTSMRQNPAAANGQLLELRTRSKVRSADFVWLPLAPRSLAPPVDEHWSKQWGMQQIRLLEGWNFAPMRQGVMVAVIDDWIDVGHPDLRFTPAPTHVRLVSQRPLDSGHGTIVAGPIAAIPNNVDVNGRGIGVAGITRASEILPIMLGSRIEDDYVGPAIAWAAFNGARVINLSLWVTPPDPFVDQNDTEYAIEFAWSMGAVICAAAGNYRPTDHPATQTLVDFPAYMPQVIAVGAVDDRLQRHTPTGLAENWGSKFGDDIDVVAPGIFIWTTDEQGGLGLNPGGARIHVVVRTEPVTLGDLGGDYFQRGAATSIATPHVSGLAALLLECFPHLTNRQVVQAIESTCRKVNDAAVNYHDEPGRLVGTWDRQMGYGLIDCLEALKYAKTVPVPDPHRHGLVIDPHGQPLIDLPGICLEGYPARSALPGYSRLYCSLDLRSWLDIPSADILRSQRLDRRYSGIDPPMTRVIVRAGSPIITTGNVRSMGGW